jgi:arylsulfatase A-like enzyme
MMTRSQSWMRWATWVVLCLGTTLSTAAEPRPRPNILLLISDDAGWGDVSWAGNTNLSTPHLDSLARDGVALEHFYVCSVCAPTRAEMLTGRYHGRTGVRGVSEGQERLNLNERTLADALHAAGYATGLFGKWHNGSQWPYHPQARGFEETYGFTSGHWGEYFDPPLEHQGQPVRGKGYLADDLTDHALQFIEQHRARPFFCYVPFNIPHSPWAVPAEAWARFKDKPLALRAEPGLKEDLDQTRCALAMMETLDANVGRLLARLAALDLTRDTIVLYLSDNGPNTFRWNGGLKGKKGTTDEGGLKSVCFLRWPGQLPAGKRVSELAGAIDLLPTLCALTGVPRVGTLPLDGRDLSPWLRGGRSEAERALFSHQAGQFSVRTPRYRLAAGGALFDLLTDPGQRTDLAATQPAVVSQLRQALTDWRRDVYGPTAAPTTDSRPYPVGYAAFPRTRLPARDAVPHGTVRRSASAPNCSYFVHWTAVTDSITWDIEVETPGSYAVEMLYTCPLADAGATVELSFRGPTTTTAVTPGWDPPLYTNQDTLPRPPAESRMKLFHPLTAPPIRLERGRGQLTLRATHIPGQSVMDLHELALTLLPPDAK